ncbi:MAG: quinolinate synthase NadA [Nitrospinales bacterium]
MTAQELYDKLQYIKVGDPLCEFSLPRCEKLLPHILKIEKLKKEKNAIILAHNYVAPEILYGVADHTGDSYGLSKAARDSDADVIVFPAVRFMAETAKLINPEKTVIDPNPNGGCSLADSIKASDVERLRIKYPSHTFVCYINTTAEVKALCDVCVTSSNVHKIIETIDNKNIYFLPDKLMGQNVIDFLEAKGVKKNIEVYDGTCYVHEEYEPTAIDFLRLDFEGVEVLAHPECKPEVVQQADYVGSTSGMLDHVRNSTGDKFVMLTECGLTGILQSEFPEKQFVGSCTMCKYMKSNSLEDIIRALEDPHPSSIIEIPPDVIAKARKSIDLMFEYAE